jgi:Flp pilus assembly protein TadG
MRFFENWKTRRRIKSTGQALILIVLTFMGLLLFLGLMVDLGQIFLAKGYLRRAADAGALAAAAQFRENRGINEMQAAAEEVAHMNGIDPTSITVQTCKDGIPDPPGADATLCPPNASVMPRKRVRVTVAMDYPLTFLSLLDIYSVHLVESSVSEAAAMDVVLVIDVSESMTWDAPPEADLPYGTDPRDPSVCNQDDSCHPFQEVKNAAASFAAEVLNKSWEEEEDRLAIVTFASGWQAAPLGTYVYLNWTNKSADAAAAINDLKVYDPGVVCPWEGGGSDACAGAGPVTVPGAWCPEHTDDIPVGMCLSYDDNGYYHNFGCPRYQGVQTIEDGYIDGEDNTISACLTTDIGGGLRVAGNQFAVEKRPDALWVVVMLTDGAANATLGTEEDILTGGDNTKILLPELSGLDPMDIKDHYPFGFCPPGTYEAWGDTEGAMDWQLPHRRFCQDADADGLVHSPMTSGNYDADDFARDQAKFVACAANNPSDSCFGQKGQGAIIFTIGLGKEILMNDDDPSGLLKPYGGSLLRYIAAIGDDGNAVTPGDPCLSETDYTKSCGNYFYASAGADLERVFELIYSRIFTRLTA